MADQAEATERLSRAALDQLLEGRRQFLSFVRSRVESAEAAEEILQSAFLKGIEKGGALRDEENVIAWFYRLLRNAIVDHYRGRGVSERASAALAAQTDNGIVPPADMLKGDICKCVSGLLDNLKPEYQDALRIVDLDERSLAALAGKAGITANNAAVRMHRAREALRKQVMLACGICATHRCLDCHCQPAQRTDS